MDTKDEDDDDDGGDGAEAWRRSFISQTAVGRF